MKKYTLHCDYCDKEITEKSDLNGFKIELGFSLGGWGNRRNFIDIHSVEICNACFKHVEELGINFHKTIRNLRQKRFNNIKGC